MTFRLGDDVCATDTDEGMVLLDKRAGRYWQLNPTGRLILRTLLDGGTARQAAEDLSRQYLVNVEQASEDVSALVGQLRSAGLVRT